MSSPTIPLFEREYTRCALLLRVVLGNLPEDVRYVVAQYLIGQVELRGYIRKHFKSGVNDSMGYVRIERQGVHGDGGKKDDAKDDERCDAIIVGERGYYEGKLPKFFDDDAQQLAPLFRRPTMVTHRPPALVFTFRMKMEQYYDFLSILAFSNGQPKEGDPYKWPQSGPAIMMVSGWGEKRVVNGGTFNCDVQHGIDYSVAISIEPQFSSSDDGRHNAPTGNFYYGLAMSAVVPDGAPPTSTPTIFHSSVSTRPMPKGSRVDIDNKLVFLNRELQGLETVITQFEAKLVCLEESAKRVPPTLEALALQGAVARHVPKSPTTSIHDLPLWAFLLPSKNKQ